MQELVYNHANLESCSVPETMLQTPASTIRFAQQCIEMGWAEQRVETKLTHPKVRKVRSHKSEATQAQKPNTEHEHATHFFSNGFSPSRGSNKNHPAPAALFMCVF